MSSGSYQQITAKGAGGSYPRTKEEEELRKRVKERDRSYAEEEERFDRLCRENHERKRADEARLAKLEKEVERSGNSHAAEIALLEEKVRVKEGDVRSNGGIMIDHYMDQWRYDNDVAELGRLKKELEEKKRIGIK